MNADQSSPNLADSNTALPSRSSQFDDAPIAVVPLAWRAEHAKHDPADGMDDSDAPDACARAYLAAFGGTVLAGGIFPFVVIVVPALLFGPQTPPGIELLAFAMIGLVVGFLVGAAFAAMAASCVFPVLGTIEYLAGLSRWRPTLATLAGGWTGFAAVAALGFESREVEYWPVQFLVFGIVAMLMGQGGAGWATRKVVRAQEASRGWRQPPRPMRFSLRQLLGLNVGVAIVAAILSALRLPTGTWMAMGIAAAVQVASLGAYLLHQRGSSEKISAA